MTDGRLAGKIALVTGAGRGIGLSIAVLFAREGAACALLIRSGSGEDAALKSLANAPHPPIVVKADVTDASAVARARSLVIERFNSVDILVNNAGVLLDEDRATPAAVMNTHVLDQTLGTNLYGPIHVCEAFVPHMPRGARVINVSSTMGQLSDGSAGYSPAYCISKTALNAYTQALAADLEPRGIMVDCFHPGWAKTAMGGPNATVDPAQSAELALFLATRPEGETGKFWRHPGVVIDW